MFTCAKYPHNLSSGFEMACKQKVLRQKCLGAVVENPSQSYRIPKQLRIDKSRVEKLFKETQTLRRAGTGRKLKTCKPVKSRKANSSDWFVQQIMKRTGVHVFKVRKMPNRTDKQNTVAESRARQLYREWLM